MGIMFIRTVILYLLTVVALRVMGKRQIGELEPTELVTTILVSEIATLPLQDMQLPLLFSVVPVFALVGLEMISSVISLNSARYRSFLAGKYNIVINEGKIDIEQMKKADLHKLFLFCLYHLHKNFCFVACASKNQPCIS